MKGILIFALIAGVCLTAGLGVMYSVTEFREAGAEFRAVPEEDMPALLIYKEEETSRFFKVTVRLYQIEGHSYVIASNTNDIEMQHSDGCQCWPPANDGGS